MTTPTTPPNTPINATSAYEQPKPNMKKVKAFTFNVELPANDKRHQKLSEAQLQVIREKFLKKDNS